MGKESHKPINWRKAFYPHGINRVILATDGDFNVGMTDFDDLIALIEKEKDHGIGLTTLGFGLGITTINSWSN